MERPSRMINNAVVRTTTSASSLKLLPCLPKLYNPEGSAAAGREPSTSPPEATVGALVFLAANRN